MTKLYKSLKELNKRKTWEVSNCCQADVRVIDDKGKIYICSCCNEWCSLELLSDD